MVPVARTPIAVNISRLPVSVTASERSPLSWDRIEEDGEQEGRRNERHGCASSRFASSYRREWRSQRAAGTKQHDGEPVRFLTAASRWRKKRKRSTNGGALCLDDSAISALLSDST